VKNGYWLDVFLEVQRLAISEILEMFICFPIVEGKEAKAFADARFAL
jgi:hypothetical protein|tara:strand:+ start:387 stop:527 length:141 start_codon:yes stop_codon:yes gene_type:complete